MLCDCIALPQDMTVFSPCPHTVLWMPCGPRPAKVSPLPSGTPRNRNSLRQQSVRKPNIAQTLVMRQDHSLMESTIARGKTKDADMHQ